MPSSEFSTTCEAGRLVLRCEPRGLGGLRFWLSLSAWYGFLIPGKANPGTDEPRMIVTMKNSISKVTTITLESRTHRRRRQRLRLGSKKTCFDVGIYLVSFILTVGRGKGNTLELAVASAMRL